jgi:hypothetical protein
VIDDEEGEKYGSRIRNINHKWEKRQRKEIET